MYEDILDNICSISKMRDDLSSISGCHEGNETHAGRIYMHSKQ